MPWSKVLRAEDEAEVLLAEEAEMRVRGSWRAGGAAAGRVSTKQGGSVCHEGTEIRV